jgi:hypothetical protein
MNGLLRRFSDSLRWPTRDEAIVTFCLAAGAFEIAFGGGRPSVLAFLTSTLTLVIAIKADRVRKENNADGKLTA